MKCIYQIPTIYSNWNDNISKFKCQYLDSDGSSKSFIYLPKNTKIYRVKNDIDSVVSKWDSLYNCHNVKTLDYVTFCIFNCCQRVWFSRHVYGSVFVGCYSVGLVIFYCPLSYKESRARIESIKQFADPLSGYKKTTDEKLHFLWKLFGAETDWTIY